MRVDVVLPQMGESIAEGTITRWIKQVGDSVQREEPLFELSTDKVDAEIPSPATGRVVEIKAAEGDTVPVNEIVAVIDTEVGEEASVGSDEGSPTPPPMPTTTQAAPTAAVAAPLVTAPPDATSGDSGTFISPVVRKIAAESGINPATIPGTGAGGRVTKKDILTFLEAAPAQGAVHTTPVKKHVETAPVYQPDAPEFAPGTRENRAPMTQMRKIIARHMIDSRRTSAHVSSVFEVDFSRVVALRSRHKNLYEERHGTRLTFTPFIVHAVCAGLRAWPVINASVDGEDIVYKRDLNIGIAVALDGGLIVPVIRNADDLSLAGLCKRVNDLAERARTKKLKPDEVQDGTFTITNPGIYGGLFGLPIINQPQVAIMGIGGIEKRPVVVDDAIAIRSMMYVSMTYDHRIVDGAVADQFLALIKRTLENFDETML